MTEAAKSGRILALTMRQGMDVGRLQEENRYAHAPHNADWTIDQDWPSYTHEEHNRWSRLFARQLRLLPGRACDAFLASKQKLELSGEGIPNFVELSERLSRLTGWRVVPVAGLIPDDAFFEHLANRRFPAGAFIRPEDEFDYLSEPDVFHDVFGHVPLLADPVYAQFLEAYGKGGQRALNRGQLHNLARLYWYTVEFGLIATSGGLRIFGAGILSSPGESVFALEDSSPNRVAFNLERIMQTKYNISDYQPTYFVIESFEQLLKQCSQDFDALYDDLQAQADIEPHQLRAGDRIITRGDLHYFSVSGNEAGSYTLQRGKLDKTKRNLNVWKDESDPEVCKAFQVYVNMTKLTSIHFHEPNWESAEFINLLISLSSRDCDIDPGWHVLQVPRNGISGTVMFNVVAHEKGEHRFYVRACLAKQMIELQVLTFALTIGAVAEAISPEACK